MTTYRQTRTSARHYTAEGICGLLDSYRGHRLAAVARDWKPREGFIYSSVRAISARINQNWDAWPSEELKKSYRSFIGKPIFVNHQNEDPKKARGKVIAARYVEAGDDRYIETIMEVDAKRFPKLAREIREGGMDSVSMGVECFVPGTQITMGDGTTKAIESIESGDEVLTHTGKVQSVPYVFSREYEGLLFEITPMGQRAPIRTTPEHPVWVLRDVVKNNRQRTRYTTGIGTTTCSCGDVFAQSRGLSAHLWQKKKHAPGERHEPAVAAELAQWVEAQDVRVGDWVLTPRSLEAEARNNQALAVVLGLYLAEGNIGRDRKNYGEQPRWAEWTLHEDETETLVPRLRAALHELGYDKLVGPYSYRGHRSATWRVNSPELAARLLDLGGSYAWAKRLAPAVMSWSPQDATTLFDNWMDGDGTHRKIGHTDRATQQWVGTTTSAVLAQQLYALAVKSGRAITPPRLEHPPSNVEHRPYYVLTARDSEVDLSSRIGLAVTGEGVWRRVTHVRALEYRGNVYNFEVEGDHSYVAENIAVHNCQFTICSHCGHKAYDEPDFCIHVAAHKGDELFNPRTGKVEPVYELCRKLGFFELSYVFEPADETAVVSRVIAAGKTPPDAAAHYSRWLRDQGRRHTHEDFRDYVKQFMPMPEDLDRIQEVYGPIRQASKETFVPRWDESHDDRLDPWRTQHEEGSDWLRDHYDVPSGRHPGLNRALTSAERVTKSQAHYREGSPAEHCGGCTMFSAETRQCNAVQGDINAHGVCDYFEPERHLKVDASSRKAAGDRKTVSRRRYAYGEITAPEDIDTLRRDDDDDPADYQYVEPLRDEENEDDNPFYHYLRSPEELRTPDLSAVRRLDREQEEDGLDTDRRVEDIHGVGGREDQQHGFTPEETEARRHSMAQRYYAADDDGGDDSVPPWLQGDDDSDDADPGSSDADYGDDDGYGDDGDSADDDSDSDDSQGDDDDDQDDSDEDDDSDDDGDDDSDDDDIDVKIPVDMLEHQARKARRQRNRSRRARKQKGRTHRQEAYRMGSLSDRTRVASRARSHQGALHYADANGSGNAEGAPYGENDQGVQEEVFLSQTPSAEAVEAPGDGAGQISNTPDTLVASLRRRINERAAGLERDIAAFRTLTGGAEGTDESRVIDPPLSGTEDQEVKGNDFEDVDLTTTPTQPKDASLRAFAAFDEWLSATTGHRAGALNPAYVAQAAPRFARAAGIAPQVLATGFNAFLRQAQKVEAERNAMNRARYANESLEVAAPQARVDVEAPVKNTTSEHGQQSQYDLHDFGKNAGDGVADPDMSTDSQIWAPGEGGGTHAEKESSLTRKADAVAALRYAQAHINAGLPYDDQWKLVTAAQTWREATCVDRTRVLEAVAQANMARAASAPRRTASVSGAPRGLPRGLARTAAPRRTAAADPSNDSILFL